MYWIQIEILPAHTQQPFTASVVQVPRVGDHLRLANGQVVEVRFVVLHLNPDPGGAVATVTAKPV